MQAPNTTIGTAQLRQLLCNAILTVQLHQHLWCRTSCSVSPTVIQCNIRGAGGSIQGEREERKKIQMLGYEQTMVVCKFTAGPGFK